MENCDLCNEKGQCEKWVRKSKCIPSTVEWLSEDYPNDREYISTDRMCRRGSIFGNDYIGLTEDDITRLKSGEIIHIDGEYGIFIGFIEKERK